MSERCYDHRDKPGCAWCVLEDELDLAHEERDEARVEAAKHKQQQDVSRAELKLLLDILQEWIDAGATIFWWFGDGKLHSVSRSASTFPEAIAKAAVAALQQEVTE